MKKYAAPVLAIVAAVIVGAKFAAKLRPQLARIPVVGKFLV